MFTARAFVFLFGPWIIDHLRVAAGQGPADPQRRAAVASHHQEGHAHHGRPDDPARPRRVDGAVGQPRQRYVWIVLGVTLALRRDRLLRRLSQGDQADPCRRFRQAALRDRGRWSRRAACYFIMSLGREPFASSLTFPFFKELILAARLVLHRVRRLHHRRRRQCGEPHRRSRRACDRAGDDRGRLLRRVRLGGRQCRVCRLSAASLRGRHRRAGGAVRRRDRRRPRLPLVQCAAGLDLHGRHRFARARRHARHDRGRHQA